MPPLECTQSCLYSQRIQYTLISLSAQTSSHCLFGALRCSAAVAWLSHCISPHQNLRHQFYYAQHHPHAAPPTRSYSTCPALESLRLRICLRSSASPIRKAQQLHSFNLRPETLDRRRTSETTTTPPLYTTTHHAQDNLFQATI